MSNYIHLTKEQQQVVPLFNGAFVENKPIPFPSINTTSAYSSLFYWAHLVAYETSEFPLHPHEGFEIMTFVFKGAIEHYDTATNVWTPLNAGGVQVIQAASGVKHSEKITKGTEMFQIWFDPNFSKSMIESASYQDYEEDAFHHIMENGIEKLFYLQENGPIHHKTPNINIEKFIFTKGNYQEKIDAEYTYSYYLLEGEMTINHYLLQKDDFLCFNSLEEVDFSVTIRAELFVIKSLTKIDYHRFIERYH